MTEAKRAEEKPEDKKERRRERTIELDAPADEVWKALTDAKELVKWFPLEARVIPGVGGKIFVSWGPDCEGEAEIVAWEPGKKFTWKESFGVLEWTLESRGGKTILRLVQSSFLGNEDWENEWFESTGHGWGLMLVGLRWILERHRGQERHVAWPRQKTNLSREEAYRKFLAAGNFFTTDLNSALRGGQPYSLENFRKEKFTGQVEFVTPSRGFCLSVRELNDALLWFSIEGSPGKLEVQAWLSTFGLPQSDVDAFRESWQAQLTKVFPN